MSWPRTTTDDSLADAVRQAQACGPLLGALRALYAELDGEQAHLAPRCRACGDCCDFDRFGHRLYVSTAELALLTRQAPPSPAALAQGRCPYQTAGQCAAREGRTLGCRVFHCRGEGASIENRRYESRHEQIAALHRTHCIPYLYGDLLELITQLPIITDLT